MLLSRHTAKGKKTRSSGRGGSHTWGIGARLPETLWTVSSRQLGCRITAGCDPMEEHDGVEMFGLILVFKSLGRIIRGIVTDPEARGLGIIAIGLIVGGATFYRSVEGFSWVDSFYFTVVTLTTVGYGDIHPATTSGRVFTIFYLLIGVGVLVSFVTVTARQMVAARDERLEVRTQRKSRRRDR